MSAVTREYAERTSESKTSLGAWKLNKRKRDSEAYQIFVSESFILVFGFGRNLLQFRVNFCVVSLSNRPTLSPLLDIVLTFQPQHSFKKRFSWKTKIGLQILQFWLGKNELAKLTRKPANDPKTENDTTKNGNGVHEEFMDGYVFVIFRREEKSSLLQGRNKNGKHTSQNNN